MVDLFVDKSKIFSGIRRKGRPGRDGTDVKEYGEDIFVLLWVDIILSFQQSLYSIPRYSIIFRYCWTGKWKRVELIGFNITEFVRVVYVWSHCNTLWWKQNASLLELKNRSILQRLIAELTPMFRKSGVWSLIFLHLQFWVQGFCVIVSPIDHENLVTHIRTCNSFTVLIVA